MQLSYKCTFYLIIYWKVILFDFVTKFVKIEMFYSKFNSRMTVFDDAVNGYAELSKEFKGKSPNLKRCGEVLNQLKICLVQLSFLPNDKEAHTKVGDVTCTTE